MSVTDVIKIAMTRQKIDRHNLAARLNVTPGSLNTKMYRGSFSVDDLIRVATALELKLILADNNGRQVAEFLPEDAAPPRRSNINDK